MWVKCKAYFCSDDHEVTGDKEVYPEDFTFDSDEVVAFNRSSDPTRTTIHLSNGFNITTDILYEDIKIQGDEILIGDNDILNDLGM